MDMNTVASEKGRVWTGIILGLLVVLLLIWLVPRREFLPKGILLPAQKLRAPIPVAQVKLLPTLPPGAKRLGVIRIQQHYPLKSSVAEREVINFARRQAARIGANGIFVKYFLHSSLPSALSVYSFLGIAFYNPALKQAAWPPVYIHPLYLYGKNS